jgi:flagellar biosynthesis protein FlhF
MTPSTDRSLVYVKSYFAASIEEAMEQARVEMGPDALLLNMRDAPPEARHLGACEAVFGARALPKPHQTTASPATGGDPLADLRLRIEELQRMMTRGLPSGHREADATLADTLCASGIGRLLATEIDCAIQRRLAGRGVVEIARTKRLAVHDTELVVRETVAELESRFEVKPDVASVAAVVGPAGAGKTSVLVKLAVTCGLMQQRPVRIVSADTYRVGAADQMRTYAAILGAPFTLAETTQALAQAIDAAPADGLLLIDTPGHSAASLAEFGQDLASLLRERQDVDTHLVLTASMRHADMERTVDQFRIFRPGKLLFTHVDETDSTAAMFCEAARTGLPVSFLSTGQSIPEDIEPASKSRISAGLVRELPQALQAVA